MYILLLTTYSLTTITNSYRVLRLVLLLNYYHYVLVVCLVGGMVGVGGSVVRLGERGKQKMNLFVQIY